MAKEAGPICKSNRKPRRLRFESKEKRFSPQKKRLSKASARLNIAQ